MYTVEPLNNGHCGDKHFVHCSEVVPLSEVEMYGQLMAGGIVGRLSSYRSVHYRRFYCMCTYMSIHLLCKALSYHLDRWSH